MAEKLLATWVVPYIGTWIETKGFGTEKKMWEVVPYIGTWIETRSGWLSRVAIQSYLI